MSTWIMDVFGVTKPIIGMCHFQALPGDPDYDAESGIDGIIKHAHRDLIALQEGGVDAVMFSNEASLPYLTEVESITTVVMARIVTELLGDIRVPFGVNVLWDAKASLDLAVASGAKFVREIFTGVYASDFGLWNTNIGKTIRYKRQIGAGDVKLLFNIVPEAASYLGDRSVTDIARSTVFNNQPDALCVSGLTAGEETSTSILKQVKGVVPDTPVFANTGVRLDNVIEQLSVADGAVIGTSFKQDGYIWNPVDQQRVSQLMQKVKEHRR